MSSPMSSPMPSPMPRPFMSPARAMLMVAGALAIGATSAAAGPVAAERGAELERLVRQDCGSCHGMTLKGGLGPDIRPARWRGVPSEAIAQVILDGVPNTPMPPWRQLLSDDEALWVADYLKKDARE